MEKRFNNLKINLPNLQIFKSFNTNRFRRSMDRTQDCGSCDLGSIPNGSTIHKKNPENSGFFL